MSDSPARARTAVDDLADAYLEAIAAADPVFATFTGLSGHDHRLTDVSPAGHAERARLARDTLAALEGLVPVDQTDAVTAAALRERLGLVIERHELGLDLADLNNIGSPVQTFRDVFDITPTATDEDWSAVAARLTAVPEALTGYRASLEAARAGGWVPPARQVGAAAKQAREFGADEGFYVAFARAARTSTGDAPGSQVRAQLEAGARAAAAAYLALADGLETELLPAASTRDAVGRDLYAVHAREFLGSVVDLDETYAWGLAELRRIERRMAEVARRLVPDAPSGAGPESVRVAIEAGIEALDADPARSITGAEEFRDWMQRVSDSAVDELGKAHFDIPAPVRTLRCRIAPSSSGAVYYTPPSEDFSRPGQMWWSVPAGTDTFSTWRETSTVYHEGVPGHHLQCGQVAYLSDRLNRWRRLGCWVSGHGEGWALYAERLMEELGYLQDDGDLMGMLDAHALRAARVVVDIGVHCALTAPDEVGGGTWDADTAWAFLRRHTRVPDAQLRFELERYLGWPGQAIAYKVGERAWLDLRERARAREGDAFDLRDFHRRALDLGSVGLDVLRSAVLSA
ncbi:MAG TPA: DUF885 domain-containing protein [Kineosporiaceae bacterium]|nr:DUF885 domain-containing protein [Kineosporiaceae bacterium]